MDFNKIADLINIVYYSYDSYEEISLIINYHSSLIKKPENLIVEPINFESFDEQYLTDLAEYWLNKEESLAVKYEKIIRQVDSDDCK